jgi:hypothetical protein
MQYPATVFDKPQWTLLPDPQGARMYGNVSNALEVQLPRRTSFFVHLAVPTELFTFMREIAKVPPQAACSLSIDVNDDGMGLFCLLVEHGGDWKLYDLWAWTRGSLPGWIMDREFRCVGG